MSRTFNTKPSKFKEEPWGTDRVMYTVGYFTYYLYTKTTKPKKKKKKDTEEHWMTTPSWWHTVKHTRPLRRKSQKWERKVIHAVSIDDIDSFDVPNISNKPHIYYW